MLFLAAIEAAEPLVMVETKLIQADVLVVHVAVVLARAGDFGELGHIVPTIK